MAELRHPTPVHFCKKQLLGTIVLAANNKKHASKHYKWNMSVKTLTFCFGFLRGSVSFGHSVVAYLQQTIGCQLPAVF